VNEGDSEERGMTRVARPLVSTKVETRSMGASRLRLVGVGVLVAALMALAAARATAASTYVHSARSGAFAGGRLTLQGVGHNVTWMTTGGRVGVAPIALAQKRLFSHKVQATGVLEIAGQRGANEFAFQLSDPRYSAVRRTVSYRATRLKGVVAAMAGAPVPRRFGAASLSVVPDVSPGTGSPGSGSPGSGSLGSGDNGGNDCRVEVDDPAVGNGSYNINLASSGQWDTDNWAISPPNYILINSSAIMESDGGLWRGCRFDTTWSEGDGSTISIDVYWPWGGSETSTCTPSNPQAYQCTNASNGGEWIWGIQPT
jgi:hypothetical protein